MKRTPLRLVGKRRDDAAKVDVDPGKAEEPKPTGLRPTELKRTGGPKQTGGLKRTGEGLGRNSSIKRGASHGATAKRDWSGHHEKVRREGRCRNPTCATRRSSLPVTLDPAHTLPRSSGLKGLDDPRATIPLCRRCHEAADDGPLLLGPLLTRTELAYAVSLAGEWEARRRLFGER